MTVVVDDDTRRRVAARVFADPGVRRRLGIT